jgi:hypothetical protein
MADVRAVVPVVSDPLGLITASGQVSTQSFGDGTLSRIEPVTSRATSHLQEVVGAASDGEDLSVAVDGNRLVRIDEATGQRESKGASAVGVGGPVYSRGVEHDQGDGRSGRA